MLADISNLCSQKMMELSPCLTIDRGACDEISVGFCSADVNFSVSRFFVCECSEFGEGGVSGN